jgi:hypothetical protein
MDARIDLAADLNDEDDEGIGWSALSEASETRGRPRAVVEASAVRRYARDGLLDERDAFRAFVGGPRVGVTLDAEQRPA